MNWSAFLAFAFRAFVIQTSRFLPLPLYRRCFHPHHGLHFHPQVRTLKSPHLLSICFLVGSISVIAIKCFGVAVKLTFGGNNQFTHPSTYVFMIIVALSIIVQMNYFIIGYLLD